MYDTNLRTDHINDYHGAAAPLYLLPKTIPCCLSLHNAEFQGLWPMRTLPERTEVCNVFNLPEKVVEEYVQFGSVFNLLHAGASYLRVHQKGIGAVGVSTKYGKRSWARYPIFWGLNKIGPLPNPDPTDTDVWDGKAVRDEDVVIDEEFEAARPELKRQAQEWAGLEQRADADLFVFVGRWSNQKGVDLIADIFPSILEENDKVQLICIGPVIDLYGKFAALKLSKIMTQYPGRVYSKPEFTALPPYIFSGAEFALIPSRDEPFGLVAVEFGRKGALGVGARVGGLGQMPGWWYTVESTTTTHLLKQFRGAIESALASKQELRRVMRARSAKQRFPVQQWKEDLGKLQSESIKNHSAEGRKRLWHRRGVASKRNSDISITMEAPPQEASLGRTQGPGHVDGTENEVLDFINQNGTPGETSRPLSSYSTQTIGLALPLPPVPRLPYGSAPSSGAQTPAAGHSRAVSMATLAPPSPLYLGGDRSSRASLLSVDDVVGDKTDYNLQKVDPFFTDSNGEFYSNFEKKLGGLTGKNSASDMCIEEFIVKSEKKWFDRFRAARLTFTPHGSNSSASSTIAPSRPASRAGSHNGENMPGEKDEFLLGDHYKPPRGLKKYMQYKWGDWPLYTFVLAIGQIISANSYQVTLLTGGIGQQASKLYAIASVYLVTSAIWWLLFRRLKSVYILSGAFVIYGAAFFVLGMSPLAPTASGRFWVQNVATGLYAAASSSGSLFFSLNFGDEGMPLLLPSHILFSANTPRWCSRPRLGLPRLHNPRNPTTLRNRPLVLGLPPDLHHLRYLPVLFRACLIPQARCRHRPYRRLHVAPSLHATIRSPRLLPPSLWLSPLLLPLPLPSQDCRLDIYYRSHPEFLPLGAVWSELAVPMEFESGAYLGDSSSCPSLLRGAVGGLPGRVRKFERPPLVDPPRLRHRPRCPALVPNALVHILHRPVPSMGWRSRGIRPPWSYSVALARAVGYRARCRLWYDFPSNAHSYTCYVHASCGSGAWFYRHHCGSRVCTERNWAWGRVS